MSRARNLADLLDSNGDVKSGSLNNVDVASLETDVANVETDVENVETKVTKVRSELMSVVLKRAYERNYGDYNFINSYIDVFQDATGLDEYDSTNNMYRDAGEYLYPNQENPTTTSVNAYETGDRQSIYSFETFRMGFEYNTNRVVNGAKSNSYNDGWLWNNVNLSDGNSYFAFRLPVGSRKQYIGAKVYCDPNRSLDQGTWVWEGSTDNQNWTTLSSSFVWHSSGTVERTWSNTTYYRWIRCRGISGSTNRTVSGSDAWNWEVEFKVANSISSTFSVPSTAHFTGQTQTSSSTVTEACLVVLYEDSSGTATLNTDLIGKVSANGGTNYSTVTLTDGGTFSGNIKQAISTPVSVTPGTAPKYRIDLANQSDGSKITHIHGVALIY